MFLSSDPATAASNPNYPRNMEARHRSDKEEAYEEAVSKTFETLLPEQAEYNISSILAHPDFRSSPPKNPPHGDEHHTGPVTQPAFPVHQPPQSYARLGHLIHQGPPSTRQSAFPSNSTRTPSPPQIRTVDLTFPDDINRDQWNNYQSPSQLDYSPDVSDSSLLPKSGNAGRMTRPSDVDSLFEDSESECVSLNPSDGADERDTTDRRLQDEIDRSSPEGLDRQLQGKLHVVSWESESATEPQGTIGIGDFEPDESTRGDGDRRWHDRRVQIESADEDSELESINAGQGHTDQRDAPRLDEVTKENAHTCLCGCSSSSCNCHPLYCQCAGCDHKEQIRKLYTEAEQKWGPDNGEGESACGCGGDQKKCFCPPGVCSCTTCEEDYSSKHAHERRTRSESAEERTCGCNGIPSKCRCLPGLCSCTICGDHTRDTQELCDCTLGRKCQCDPDECTCIGCDEHTVYKSCEKNTDERPMQREKETETRPAQGEPGSLDQSVQANDSVQLQPGYQPHLSKAQTPDSVIADQRAKTDVASGCSCEHGYSCTCLPGSCKCSGHDSEQKIQRLENQLWETSRTLNEGPKLEQGCHHHNQGSISQLPSTSTATTRIASPSPPWMSLSREESVSGSSRPDTPRPPPDQLPAIPYAASSRMMSPDYVRQSVEPELPPANWVRESTPGYEDRSGTPSPYSRRGGDVEMRDVSYTGLHLDNGFLQPPSLADLEREQLAMRNHRPPSPKKPVIPPVPDTMSSSWSPLKQPKRGDRQGKSASAVQGARVDKARSVTGSTAVKQPKSRNVTRKPTTGVGKLVAEQAKKNKEKENKKETATATSAEEPAGKEDGGHDQGDNQTKKQTDGGGKVAEAVANIEKQLKRREEEEQDKRKTQKDGTPVRRSTRANKGMRTSLGTMGV